MKMFPVKTIGSHLKDTCMHKREDICGFLLLCIVEHISFNLSQQGPRLSKAEHYERKGISIASTRAQPSLPTSNDIKKPKWQPFEVTEFTSSFISFGPHQRDPLYRNLNLGGIWRWQIDLLIQFDREDWQPCHVYLEEHLCPHAPQGNSSLYFITA